MIKKSILIFCGVLMLSGCLPKSNTMEVSDAYMFATPKAFPAAAVFMTIENNRNMDDRMVDFKTVRAGRAELHTMETINDVMKMRRVNGYDIAAGETHTLKPMADHIMVFDMATDFVEGETIDGIAVFENAGEVPVSVVVKPRSMMMKHH